MRTFSQTSSTIAASATDAAIQQKIFRSGTTLIFSNEYQNNIMKIIKSLEESDLLMKVVSETIKNGGLLGMLIYFVGASLLGNMMAGKRIMRASKRTIRGSQDF